MPLIFHDNETEPKPSCRSSKTQRGSHRGRDACFQEAHTLRLDGKQSPMAGGGSDDLDLDLIHQPPT
jgi:hypothetical protein